MCRQCTPAVYVDQGSQFVPPAEILKAAFALHWASYAQASSTSECQ